MPSRTIHRAGFWIRSAATVLDGIALLVLAGGASVIMLALWDSLGGRARAERVGQVCLYGGFLFYTVLEIWTAGTPGKLLLGLRIAAQDGSPADFWRRTLRWSSKQFWLLAALLFILTGFPLFYLIGGFSSLVVLVGCFYAADDDHLAWHDQWASTAVYHRRRGSGEVTAVLPPPPMTPPPAA
jgi:uncharacterized RDD family membrane protein YckC